MKTSAKLIGNLVHRVSVRVSRDGLNNETDEYSPHSILVTL